MWQEILNNQILPHRDNNVWCFLYPMPKWLTVLLANPPKLQIVLTSKIKEHKEELLSTTVLRHSRLLTPMELKKTAWGRKKILLLWIPIWRIRWYFLLHRSWWFGDSMPSWNYSQTFEPQNPLGWLLHVQHWVPLQRRYWW